SIFAKDRIGLIGPNGAGKTTLLKILAGLETPDTGILSPRKGLRVGYVPQACEFPPLPVEKILVDVIQEDLPAYEKERLAQMWLSKLGFTGNLPHATDLSGGWKKRLGLACALISEPDLIFYDEPTNHLDVEGIVWLEKFLTRESPTYLLVSHDRYFLQNVTNQIVEIDPAYPKGMFAIEGTYARFLEKKGEFLAGQLQQERSLGTKMRRETEWLRQGVKARTTKSQSRIDAAEEVLAEHSAVRARNRSKRAEIDFAATERQTRKLLTAKNLKKEVGGKVLFQGLDLLLSPGSRLGLLGPNGSGKTTLLRMLAGEVEPDQGTIKRADDLKTVYFDQMRAQLPLDLRLRDALSPKGDYVSFRGQEVHVNGWCKRFLFSPDHLELPIGTLSGGERARIAVAHLMLQPADVLLLDEPTNDLDIATLETLEESLLEFPGAVVLITHDRCMLDRICNGFITLGGEEGRAEPEKQEAKREEKPKGKLSYMEKKEFEAIEGKIAKWENEVKELNQLLESREVAQDAKKLNEICQAIGV
ncbi:MAG: ATP-binding cassette domain-containing protein, partial [Verrucomicrobia bacterium]|nr:ATP-binding cassette domain-containing protein [Verrucomicrobiota bacterium]